LHCSLVEMFQAHSIDDGLRTREPERREHDHASTRALPGLRRLFSRFADSALHFSYGMTGDARRAEALVHEAFARLVHENGSASRIFTAKEILAMVADLCLEHLAKARRGPAGDGANDVERALHRLPPEEKAALLLSRIDGLSFADVGDCLHTSAASARSLVARASRALIEELSPALARPEPASTGGR
jgi:DNA-directed RNA polymerase specialized sigma24 family protein